MSSVVTGLPKSVVVVAAPFNHFQVTRSAAGPLRDFFSASCALRDRSGRRQLGRGAAMQPPLSGSQVSQGPHDPCDPPAHVPPWHTPPTAQESAPHDVPSGAFASAGQSLLTPSQLSATSHAPVAGRHTPVRFTSGGQLLLLPSQVSATSHIPAAPRQVVPAGAGRSGGQLLLAPSQLSVASQPPAAARHGAVLFASAGQAVEVPVQVSATSQGPAAGLHTAPAFPGACWQVPVALQRSRVQGLLSLVHALPPGSNWQVGEQQSPATWLPSSHCSPADTTWSPQMPCGRVLVVVVPPTTVDVVVVTGQLTQQGRFGSSWIVAAGVTTAREPIAGAGGCL